MRQPETRPSLIVRLQGQRNELAWTEFVSAYEPFLLSLIRRQGVPDRHVADVAQQVLAAIARSVESWRDDGNPASFRRWVSRVARNVVIKFMTRERRQVGGRGGSDVLELLNNVPDAPDREGEHAYEYELILWIAEKVRGEFRETSWKAFWATLVEGRSVADVAAELGVTPGSIYMSRSRIMARIQAMVREVMTE
ncbi:MAG: sigma-70 family RNA polymerase sigma factor [Planctomycetes bacterium]|nr:sigma-70 family RNA polymerase sigma factor [Planctomycetota bacterium]